jgi:hypothetical protein
MQCWKIRGGEVVLDNFRIVPGPATITLRISGHKDVYVGRICRDIYVNDANINEGSTAIEVDRSFDVTIIGLRSTASTPPTGNAYPLAISNSQKVTISNCSLYSSWHCLAIGGRGENAAIPPRDILIDQCILENDYNQLVPAADIHGNAINVTYSNCITHGISLTGRNVSAINCTVYGRNSTDGLCIYSNEVSGGVFRIHNCSLITLGNGASFGIIYATVNKIIENFYLDIKNTTITNNGIAGSATVRCVMVVLGEADLDSLPHRVDISIQNFTYRTKAREAFSILSINGMRNIIGKSSAIVDGITCTSNVSLVGCTNTANYAMPMRLQRQSGVYSGTTAVATLVVANPITFRYLYPRIPATTVGVRGVGGDNFSTVGGQVPVPGVYKVTGTQIRPSIQAVANFTAGGNYEQPWSVEINDGI